MSDTTTRVIRGKLRARDDEWKEIVGRARAAGVRTMRYVREAAMGRPPGPRRQRGVDVVVLQLSRILNNLQQLTAVAEDLGDETAVALLADVTTAATAAVRSIRSAGASEDAERSAEMGQVGTRLNEAAHRANSTDELPDGNDLLELLAEVEATIRRVAP
jgi:uncharacterized membrane protein YccC